MAEDDRRCLIRRERSKRGEEAVTFNDDVGELAVVVGASEPARFSFVCGNAGGGLGGGGDVAARGVCRG